MTLITAERPDANILDLASPHSLRTIGSNTLWTLLSTVGPLIIGAFCLPFIVHSLDPTRYGLLTLSWSVIGYFALLDLGLGRAITHVASNSEEGSSPTGIPQALAFLAVLGVLASILLALLAPAIARWLAPANLQRECFLSIRLLSVSVPFITVSAGVRGLLEAAHRFKLVAFLRFGFTTFTFLGPAIAVFFNRSLVPVVGMLALSRILWGLAIIWIGWDAIPEVFSRHPAVARPLLNFAIWTTLFNLVAPLLVYGDRFVVTAMVSAAAVGFYATPFEVLTRFSLIPAALSGVLFPTFSSQWRESPDVARQLLYRGIEAVGATMFVACGAAVLLFDLGIRKWLGAAFAAQSRTFAGWLAAGVFINGVAFVPVTFLQGVGRPDIPSKLSLLELPIHGLVLYLLVARGGIKGAAIAWSLRVFVDCIATFACVAYLDETARRGLLWRLAISLTGFGTLVYLREATAW